VTVEITDTAPAGSYYVISVMYTTNAVKTQPAVGYPTVDFSFRTHVDGIFQETDLNGVTLAYKFPTR
jgi:hypothetical protein